MTLRRAVLSMAAATGALFLVQSSIQPAAAGTTTIILKGKVLMVDGSVPTKSVEIQRECSDTGSAPGPLADKKGNWVWSQALDPMATRACFLEAQLEGFASTLFQMMDIPLSAYQGSGILEVPTFVLQPKDSGDLGVMTLPKENNVPGKAEKQWNAMLKSMKAGDEAATLKNLEAAVEAAGKFPDGWHLLGAMYERDHELDKARDALNHAIQQNPKLLGPELRLARICDELADWACAAKASDTLIKAEPRFYPEIYLQQAIARAGTNDLDGAQMSLQSEAKLDPTHRYPRSEYVLARILLAKGDVPGAKDHMTAYLQQDPRTPDAPRIKAEIENLGKADAPKPELSTLERPY